MIILSFIFLLLAIAVYYTLTITNKKEKYEDAKLKVMLFYATWCPHCERYLESGKYKEFEETLTKKYNGVVFYKYDYDKNQVIGDKYKVNSFPTILAEDSKGNTYRFYGDRMKETHVELFVKKALSGEEVSRDHFN
jgi:thiol-disulfide isomerase/thioredoxin